MNTIGKQKIINRYTQRNSLEFIEENVKIVQVNWIYLITEKMNLLNNEKDKLI